MFARCARSLLRPTLSSHVRTQGVKFYVPVREEIPEYDLDTVEAGERIVTPLTKEYTTVQESTAEWNHVLNVLPLETVPDTPEHNAYPTPSGWVPPKMSALEFPYFVRRNRFHNYPLYLRLHDGGQRKMTVLKYIEGDIWQMEADMRAFLRENSPKRILTQVDEVCRKIRVRGVFVDEVSEFLKKKGF